MMEIGLGGDSTPVHSAGGLLVRWCQGRNSHFNTPWLFVSTSKVGAATTSVAPPRMQSNGLEKRTPGPAMTNSKWPGHRDRMMIVDYCSSIVCLGWFGLRSKGLRRKGHIRCREERSHDWRCGVGVCSCCGRRQR